MYDNVRNVVPFTVGPAFQFKLRFLIETGRGFRC
jgi:hypothetical protein